MSLLGLSLQQIVDKVPKPDGTRLSKDTVASVIQHAKANGGHTWDGEMHSEAGRPRSTTPALDKKIVRIVFKYRARTVVTAKYIRKVLPAARKISVRTIQKRLGEAGLAWLRRRRKTIVPTLHREARLRWSTWVMQRTAETLNRWAYTDGTVFYLASSMSLQESKFRARLGPMVWRMTDGSDALYEDCIGPSTYAKSQGVPVRVWGLLVAGVLFITVLPAGERMNGTVYARVIKTFFQNWLEQALGRKTRLGVFLVQDHERALWRDAPREEMKRAGLKLLERFPKCSQDLSPIEQCWRELRARLDVTMPMQAETRDEFIKRLRLAVAWLNRNRSGLFRKICRSQREYAMELRTANPPGSRLKH